eukprot:4021187-Alexandrium_andersonii.AAC.1
MSPEEAMGVAHQLIDEADVSVLEGEASGPEPMTDVVTEEEQRLIEADAQAAAKNGFPQLRTTPSAENGAGVGGCRELLLKFREATRECLEVMWGR